MLRAGEGELPVVQGLVGAGEDPPGLGNTVHVAVCWTEKLLQKVSDLGAHVSFLLSEQLLPWGVWNSVLCSHGSAGVGSKGINGQSNQRASK